MDKKWFEGKVKNEEGSQTNAGVSASGSNELLCDEHAPEMVDIRVDEMVDLILYADTAAKILRENGWPGKAEALEKRYMKFKHLVT